MTKPVVGILGAGKLGTTLARLGINAGYEVNISGSGDPKKIELSVNVLANGAKSLTSNEVIKNSDIIILAMPLSKSFLIDNHDLAGKLAIDAMNYWWEIDGTENTYYDDNLTSSQAVQNHFKDSLIVKAFNHMGYHDLNDEANNPKKRKSIAYAGNDESSNEIVKKIIDDFGFDAYFLGGLESTNVLQPGGILFGVNETKEGLKKLLSDK